MYLGIDPGTTNIGLCLADERQVIAFLTVKGKSTLGKDERLGEMMPQVENFLLGDEKKITCAFIEYPVVFKNVKSSMAVAESLGRIKSLLFDMGIKVQDVNVVDVKKEVKAIKKEDIIAKTMIECETHNWIKPSTEHEADAYRIMKTGVKKFLVDNLLKNAKEKDTDKKKSRNSNRAKGGK